ncbi:hypothetical protein ACSQ5K_15170 [Pseudomonas sp. PhalM4]
MHVSTRSLLQPVNVPLAAAPWPDHVVYACVQWLGANLEPLPQAAEQKFCVMFEHLEDDRLVMTLERAYVQGMMSSVKLVVQHLDDLYLFLDSSATWSTLATVRDLWQDCRRLDPIARYSTVIAGEAEIRQSGSTYPFQAKARKILDSNKLGLDQYKFHDLEPFDPEEYDPEGTWSFLDPNGG